MRRILRNEWVAAVLIVALVPVGSALAQDEAPAEEAGAGTESGAGTEFGTEEESVPDPVVPSVAEGVGDDELIVSARRREEGLQSAPVAVTAFSARALERRNIESTEDLSLFTPNLQFDGAAALSGASANATAFIRGIGQNDFAIFSDPGVGIYVDDVYLGRSIGGVLDVVDLQRVEVLRGPQGTLFGRNTIGGAVLLTSLRPSFDPDGYVELTGGSYYRANLRAGLNAPIIDDTLAVRVSAAKLSRDGYARRLIDGGELGDVDRTAARLQLLWEPHDDVEVLAIGDWTRAREHSAPSTLIAVSASGYPFLNLFNALVAPTTGITQPSSRVDAAFITRDPYTTYATGPNISNLDSWGVSLTPVWEIAKAVSLKSITAYRSLDAEFGRDGDNTPFTFRETYNKDEQWQVSQELQLFGDAWGDALSWIVGGYYFQERAVEHGRATLAQGLFNQLQMLPGPMSFPGGPPNCMGMDPIMPMPGCYGGPMNVRNVGADLVVDLYNQVENRTFAGFAHASLEILPGLSVTGGLRFTHETKDFVLVHRRVTSGAYIVPPGSEFSAPWSSFDPKAGLEYQATDGILAYFTWSRGFKSGGFNGRPLVSVAEVTKYEPESLWSYEVGLKTEWLDRALIANVAAFYYDYHDIQLTVNQTPQNFVANAARARLMGGELELRARPVRAFQIDVSAGYLNAEYQEVGQGLGPMQTLPITTASKLPKAPALTISGGAEYTLELSDEYGGLFFRADLAYRSKVWNDVANTPIIAQDGYALLGARVAWFSSEEDWELALFATNLTDTRYQMSGNAASIAFGVVEASYAPPRELGVTLTRRF